jgi:hypothetical protein
MGEEIIFIAIFGLLLFYGIAEVFGRSRHIGKWWSFVLLSTSLIFGILAIIFSPSAKKQPTKGNKTHKIFAWVCVVIGSIGLFTLNPASLGVLILGFYLFELSKGYVKNNNPKFYFNNFHLKTKNKQGPVSKNVSGSDGLSNYNNKNDTLKETPNKDFSDKENNINAKYETLKYLLEKGILTNKEYQVKINSLNNEKFDNELKEREEYIKLKSLYESKMLSKQEFEHKVKVLQKKIEYQNNEPLDYDYKISDVKSEGYYLITDDDLNYGYADENKNIVINPKYEYASSFKDGLALVRLGGVFGFIDKKENAIIPFKYDNAEHFDNGKAKVKFNDEIYFINKNGERI